MDGPVVMSVAELGGCLHPSVTDYADILITFGGDASRLMRQMEVRRSAGDGVENTNIWFKRIQSDSKDRQRILLACLIVDTSRKLGN